MTETTGMQSAHTVLERFAEALEAKANAGTQIEDDSASDQLIEAVGDMEQRAAETAELLRLLLSSSVQPK